MYSKSACHGDHGGRSPSTRDNAITARRVDFDLADPESQDSTQHIVNTGIVQRLRGLTAQDGDPVSALRRRQRQRSSERTRLNKGSGSRLPPFLQFKVMPYGYCREKAHKLCWAIPAIMMGVSFQASGRPVAIIRPQAGSTRARNAQRRKVDRVRHADRALCQPCAG